MSTVDPHPDKPAQDDLVAYLDGELPPETCRRIEAQLATDHELRRQLQQLDRAWDALDALPQTTVDDDFARTTIEMVTMAAERELTSRTAGLAGTHRRRMLLSAVGAVAVAAAGFVAARALMPDANELLLRDLPTITRVDLLTQFKDVEFLRRLQDLPLEGLTDDQETLDYELAKLQAASAPSWEDRRQWIASLTPDRQADLAAKSKRFRSLSPNPAEQLRLSELERQIAEDDHAAELQRTMVAYGQWLAKRPPGEQAELRDLPADERLQRIEELVRREARRAAGRLSDEDARRLRQEWLAIVEERREQIDQMIQQRRGREGDPSRHVELRRGEVARWFFYQSWRDDQTRDALRERLIGVLSQAAQARLDSMSTRERDWQLMRWVRSSVRLDRSPQELEKFFADEDKLSNDQRERLLSLPAAEMEAELERLYVDDQLGLRDAEWPRGFGDRGRFNRDPAGRPPWGPEGRGRDRGPRDGPGRDEMDRGAEGPGPPGRGGRPRPDRPPPQDGPSPPDRRPPPI